MLTPEQIELLNKDECDHDWEFQDDSFDHAFGTEQVHYERCTKCGETRDAQPPVYDEDY